MKKRVRYKSFIDKDEKCHAEIVSSDPKVSDKEKKAILSAVVSIHLTKYHIWKDTKKETEKNLESGVEGDWINVAPKKPKWYHWFFPPKERKKDFVKKSMKEINNSEKHLKGTAIINEDGTINLSSR